MGKNFGSWQKNPAQKDFEWGKGTVGKRCYEDHPPLDITDKATGKVYQIYGGNCFTPIVSDADIYIGFAGAPGNPSKKMPWEEGYRQVVLVDYPITDMQAPSNKESFHKLVTWTVEQLRAGKKIHGGCIGGHGRTGTWLAAVVAEMGGVKDAVQYVRTNYCKKAVESAVQIDFLMKEFGCSKAEVSKPAYSAPAHSSPQSSSHSNWPYANGTGSSYGGGKAASTKGQVSYPNTTRRIEPEKSSKCIF